LTRNVEVSRNKKQRRALIDRFDLAVRRFRRLFIPSSKMNKDKIAKKYLAKIVKIKSPGTEIHNKVGVVMDDEYFYRGIICCRVIVGSEVYNVEHRDLQMIQI